MTQETQHNVRTALFAGSFNPFTTGHASLVERGLRLFDRVIIAVGVNVAKADNDAAERLAAIRRIYALDTRVEVTGYSGLTADFAHQSGATCLLRGARTSADFEAERTLADINRSLTGIDTVILPTEPELAMVSSSMVRELRHFGHDVSPYLPTPTDD